MWRYNSPFISHDYTKSNEIPKFEKLEVKNQKEFAEDLHSKGYQARWNGDY